MENQLEKAPEKGEFIAYHTDGSIHLDVKLLDDTVWLNRQQIALLFNRDVKTIGKHINNALSEELQDIPTVANFAIVQTEGGRTVTRNADHYNLDMILSIGYRVKSSNGVKFRQWANKVLKDHLLKGYSINQRLLIAEERIDHHLANHENRLNSLEKQVDFFIKINTPPTEGTIPAKSWWSGYEFAAQLVRSAKKEIIIIDPYADDRTLRLLAKKSPDVNGTIFSAHVNRTMRDEEALLNRQNPTVKVLNIRDVHDRFIIIDETVYHVGASINDLGKQLTAFSVFELLTKGQLLNLISSPSIFPGR
ncbi:MAG: virulence RhuM family protein [Candidatus Saccharibacteria bacterium]|nr:virulence RhuM family protein [Candidatus Saccharibacteria bacterium]